MPREQLALAMDTRSARERAAYDDLAAAYDEARELVERVAAAAEYEGPDEVAAAVAACVEWWRSQ